jgi:hypothetical protein
MESITLCQQISAYIREGCYLTFSVSLSAHVLLSVPPILCWWNSRGSSIPHIRMLLRLNYPLMWSVALAMTLVRKFIVHLVHHVRRKLKPFHLVTILQWLQQLHPVWVCSSVICITFSTLLTVGYYVTPNWHAQLTYADYFIWTLQSITSSARPGRPWPCSLCVAQPVSLKC